MPTTPPLPTNPVAHAALASVSQGLGALCWWSLANTRVTPDRLREILADEGADPTIVPTIDLGTAVKRAARDWSSGRGKAERFRAEVAREDNALFTIGILRREQVSATEVRWVQVDQVVFDAATGSWCDPGKTDQAASFIGEANEVCTTLDHAWIRPEILQAGLREARACSLRDRGGVYYVPQAGRDVLDRLGRIIAKIGSCRLDVVHVEATTASQSAIANSANSALRDELGELVAQIGRWTESSRKVAEPNAASVLGELDELRQRADLYADALQVSLDDVLGAIASAKAEADRILGAQVATAQRPAPAGSVAEGPDVVAYLQEFADHGADADGVARVANATLLEVGLLGLQADGSFASVLSPATGRVWTQGPTRYWHATGPGGKAAATIGLASSFRAAGGPAKAYLRLAPLDWCGDPTDEAPTQAEVVVPESPVEAAPVEVVSTDSDEAAELREKLAGFTPAAVRATYVDLTGKTAKLSKALMIEAIVQATVANA